MRTSPLLVLMLCLGCQKQPAEPQLKQAPDIVPDRSSPVVEAPGDAGDSLGDRPYSR